MLVRPVWAIAALALALPAAGAAAAQTPSPQEIARQVIDAAHAEDLFVSVDAGEMPTARHLRSGLICLFFPGGPANRIQIAAKDGPPRGDDVSCSTSRGAVNLDVFAARYAPSVTVDDQMTKLTADLSRTLDNGQIRAGPPLQGPQPMRTAYASGAIRGFDVQVFALVGQVNRWTLTLVCMEPGTEDRTCRTMVAALAKTELSSMLSAAADPPR